MPIPPCWRCRWQSAAAVLRPSAVVAVPRRTLNHANSGWPATPLRVFSTSTSTSSAVPTCTPRTPAYHRTTVSQRPPTPRLDYQHVRDNAQLYTDNCRDRNISGVDVQHIIDLYDQYCDLKQQLDHMRSERNMLSKRQKPTAGDKQSQQPAISREELIQRGRQLKMIVGTLESELSDIEAELQSASALLPNLTSRQSPIGDETQIRVTQTFNQPTDFNAEQSTKQTISHTDLCQYYDWCDFDAAAVTTGSRFYIAKKELALLEMALQQYVMQLLVKRGFEPVLPPDIVRHHFIAACGFQPRTVQSDSAASQIYTLRGHTHTSDSDTATDSQQHDSRTDLALIGTSEHPLAAMYSNTLFHSAAALPVRLVAFNHCFRTEAGAAGQASKGLYRVHQFSKVEMFIIAHPHSSDQVFDEILSLQQELYTSLGLHYRMVELPTSDLGASAYRKVDCEAWMPSRGSYGEISSTSNCTDYQARRLNIKYRTDDQQKDSTDDAQPHGNVSKTEFVHTLNGTGVAIPRVMLAILEQHQQPKDGSMTQSLTAGNVLIRIPEVLQPYMMTMQTIPSPLFSPETAKQPFAT